MTSIAILSLFLTPGSRDRGGDSWPSGLLSGGKKFQEATNKLTDMWTNGLSIGSKQSFGNVVFVFSKTSLVPKNSGHKRSHFLPAICAFFGSVNISTTIATATTLQISRYEKGL